jgi:GT2 family glycosyltransferase
VESKVHIVVLNWNGCRDTFACLSSLQHLIYCNYRVLVVDNGSTDDSAQSIRRGFPAVELIETGRNLGFAGGCNVGIRHALAEGADFVWLLNNDTIVDPDALKALVDKATTDPTIGAVGSAIYFMEERESLQCWGGGYINFWMGRSANFVEPVDNERLQFITGASMLLPRSSIDEIGLFDEGFFMYWEDADYCFRLRCAAKELAVAGQSKVWHKTPASIGKGSVNSYHYFNASASRFMEKHAHIPLFSFWVGFSLRLAKRLLVGDWAKTRAVWAGMKAERAAHSPHSLESDFAFYGSESDRLAARLRTIEGLDELERLGDVPETLFQLRAMAESPERRFPHPRQLWSLSKFDAPGEWDCLKFLAPVEGKRVAQIGGTGAWAVAFALAGASESWLISPFQPELDAGLEIARLAKVDLRVRLCPAEQLAFEEGYFDAIFAPGCAHHFETEEAFPEIHRALRAGGKFAAIDPWLTPVYHLGIRVFGKRERGVKCVPLDAQRMIPFYRSFPGAEVRHHGTFTRYPLILLERFVHLPDSLVWSALRLDDAFSTLLGCRRLGSGVALLAQSTGVEEDFSVRASSLDNVLKEA